MLVFGNTVTFSIKTVSFEFTVNCRLSSQPSVVRKKYNKLYITQKVLNCIKDISNICRSGGIHN